MAYLQAQVMQMKAQIAGHQTSAAGDLRNSSESTNQFMTWQQTSGSPIGSTYSTPYNHHHPYYGHVNPNNPVSPQSSLEESFSNTSSDVTTTANVREITHQTGGGVYGHDGLGFHEGYPNKKRSVSYCSSDLGELQALALRMMKN